ncbi:heme NO-binding protein [Paracoccus caeni]|uniref:Heme NO-binding protein n=1 Tax=Paracoccus caeni TaxID=657651 RepID=A0A934SEI9_9RHOB|nr:heme NO-binding protein [Paracoccus caeni]MBK4215516.1 heme NO-binding protein [Paracoccus caeni]
MHRLIDRAIEEFLRDTYGDALLGAVQQMMGRAADLPAEEGLHDNSRIHVAARRLAKPADELFEDLGAWLARQEAIRRLLRFSGREFAEFVIRLDELPGRAHMILPDICMPAITVTECSLGDLRVILPERETGWTALLAGMLRVMADDYGALGLISVEGSQIGVLIPDAEFAQGRDFQLGAAFAARGRGV